MTYDAQTHNDKLLAILKDIYSDPTIASLVGFKGGTAAAFFYGLDRFSVDLDFDVLDEGKEKYIFDQVHKIAMRHGAGTRGVKIEINRRKVGSRFAVKNYLGISMLVTVQEDMFAHKLMAMADRIGRANRDVYDVWFFLTHQWPINKELVVARSGTSFKLFLQHCIVVLEKLDNRGILNGVGEFLSEKQKNWARTNLKKDTLFWLNVMAGHEK